MRDVILHEIDQSDRIHIKSLLSRRPLKVS